MNKASHTISGSVGDIELRFRQTTQTDNIKLVVLSHPHPLYGGTMDNKVITTMERAFLHQGYATLAYNFRGVGASHGAYDQGVGEQDDLKAVIEWAREEFNVVDITLAAFSFGCYVSLKALPSLDGVSQLCLVAPPVGLYDFSDIDDVQIPWLIIQGGEDEVVDSQEVLDWAMSRTPKPDLIWRAQASHFFHGELVWLRKLIQASY